MTVTITLIGKPDCHLCDLAREVIASVIQDAPGEAIDIRELSILDDPQLYEQWWQKIPVVLVGDRFHAHWRVDATRLRTAIEQAGENR